MKSKERRYEKAIARNLNRFVNYAKTEAVWPFLLPPVTLTRYLRQAKYKIGIKQSDTRFDDQLKVVLSVHNVSTKLFI